MNMSSFLYLNQVKKKSIKQAGFANTEKKYSYKYTNCPQTIPFSQTKFFLSLFSAWCIESLGQHVDLATVSVPDLDQHLRKFYAEAAPRNPSGRSKKMSEEQSAEYHKNSFKNVRAAINRHMKDIGRDVDIVRDKEFKSSNGMLNA